MVRATLATALLVLAGCGHFAYVGTKGGDDRTPLEKAAEAGDIAAVKRLLASGADPNDPKGVYSPLNAAVFRNDNAAVIRALIAAGAKPEGRGQSGNTCWTSPLFHAAAAGNVENARALLDAGASFTQQPCPSVTKFPVGWLKPAILDLLVEHGLDLKALDENGRNNLHLALAPPIVPPVESIEYLLRAGVPVNARDRFGKTPLAYWREDRDYERRWIVVSLFEWIGGRSAFDSQRAARARITTVLQQRGAVI